MGAFPQMMTPPQSPGTRVPAGLLLVNTMGHSLVPWAQIWAPRLMINDPPEALSPRMSVPAGIVILKVESMKYQPVRIYVVSRESTRFVVSWYGSRKWGVPMPEPRTACGRAARPTVVRQRMHIANIVNDFAIMFL